MVRPRLRLLVLIGALVGSAASFAASSDAVHDKRRRSSAVAAVLGPGPGLERPECDPASKIICSAEATATRPACDGFVGDPMFLWMNHLGPGVVYCRRRDAPPGHDSWLALHPESCLPGETRHSCSVPVGSGEGKGSCPEYESDPEYYRIYPLNAHGGHKGLSPRPGEYLPYNRMRSERAFCRHLKAIKAEQELTQRKTDEAFRRDLIRKIAMAAGVLGALILVWALSRRR